MPKTAKLEAAITVKFARSEVSELEARAKAAGLPLRTFIRREMLSAAGVSRETALVLAEVGRTRELLGRLWQVSLEMEMRAHQVADVGAGVDAIEGRVFVARALGGK